MRTFICKRFCPCHKLCSVIIIIIKIVTIFPETQINFTFLVQHLTGHLTQSTMILSTLGLWPVRNPSINYINEICKSWLFSFQQWRSTFSTLWWYALKTSCHFIWMYQFPSLVDHSMQKSWQCSSFKFTLAISIKYHNIFWYLFFVLHCKP